ncbi:O-methyltransferase [Diaporthe helianthi]|uniref:O-methyltransferase n=1 Tax=Diaporthe helianthi TaxID=158607 RepID=A0A2P5HVB6_DIAHE|nr:O-methyltransferase [Diaporthe helianthi]
MESEEDINTLLEQLESVASAPPQDPELQLRLYHAAQKLVLAVEAPLDTVNRVIYSPMLLSNAQTASYMQIFSTLTEKAAPCTVKELAEPTGADVIFTARILRFLSSHGLISEVAGDTFEANRLTKTLSLNVYRAGMNLTFQTIAPIVMKAPDFFKLTRFQNPDNNVKTPFQMVQNTDQPAMEWAHEHRPDLVADFGAWMGALSGPKTWLDVIDFESLIKGSETEESAIIPDMAVFVDVGGGIGSQCAMLKAKLPNLPGRVILQDLPFVLQYARPTEGVEITAHNFWTEQPVRGARAYYFRNILRDYPDDKCLAILENTVAAMEPESMILIDDVIVPDKGAHPRTTEMDCIMMTMLAATERTRTQWDKLLDAAGLEAVQRATYLDDTAESIQVVVLKDRATSGDL